MENFNKNLDNNLMLIKRGEQYITDKKWNLIATSKTSEGKKKIKQELTDFGLQNIPYLPHLIIQKDKISFIVMMFWKEQFPYTKKGIQYTGMDWYKYMFLREIEKITHTMVGLIMYSSQEGKMIFRQMNQLPKPMCWFRDYCLVKENKLIAPLDCVHCSTAYPDLCNKCINGKKGKTMAIWDVNEFESGLSVQTSLLC